jgi:shikimate dehydrogenase
MESKTIRGNTRLVGILGNPVRHSLSPLIHNHAFSKLGLPFVYIPLPVVKQDLHTALYALRAFNFAGANVTVPYKSDVIHYCDTVSGLSKLTGTVNTLYFENDLLAGTTTDAIGFFRALESGGRGLDGKDAVVIAGNGGTARTLGFALALERKAASLVIIGRNRSRIEALSSDITRETGFPVIAALLDSKEGKKLLKECTLLVNATSAGLFPDTDSSPLQANAFHKGMYVFDTIYNPAQTRFLNYAEKAGCQTQNGLRMLLYQGVASFKYWTSVEADETLFDIEELHSLM